MRVGRSTLLYPIALLIGNEMRTATTYARQEDCGLYLAPSTIPGAGLGMFAGNRPFNVGDVVSYSDLMIMVNDMDWHNGGEEADYSFLWEEYTWSVSTASGMEDEVEDAYETAHVAR